MWKPVRKTLDYLGHHSKSWWYPPAIGLLAFADLFILVVPTDAILISGVMVAPRRWAYIGLTVAAGSALGCIALAHLLHLHGLPWLLHLSPGIDHTHAWEWTARKMQEWGAWGVFLVALSPMMQHPAVALAAISGMSLPTIFVMVFLGRAIKYLFFAWLASHAPHVLKKLWFVKREVHDAGLDEKCDEPPCGEK